MTDPTAPATLDGLRLPAWLLPQDWPRHGSVPAPARVSIAHGRFTELRPLVAHESHAVGWNLRGTLALPGLVDAHTHLDKAFTRERMRHVPPGLLGAIEAMMTDRLEWTAADVRTRAERALQWAWVNGTTHLRTHVDWWEPDAVPIAWHVLAELAQEWRGRVQMQQAGLIKLDLFEDPQQARRLARIVAGTGPNALLGGFVHSTNFSELRLRHLLQAAQAHDLNVDLHVDEELNPEATGLATIARIVNEIGFEGRVVCGHCCALGVQPESQALATLDTVARAPITLVSLPATNLLLQDATTGRTPRQRGVTLVHETRARGIPLLIASDNVQDPFCAFGSFDPAEALGLGAMAAQLDRPFDQWSDAICRSDWLQRERSDTVPSLVGRPADLVLFPSSNTYGWPSRSHPRIVLRDGRLVQGEAAAEWLDDQATGTEGACRTALSSNASHNPL